VQSIVQKTPTDALQLELVRDSVAQSVRPLFKVEMHNKTARLLILCLGWNVGGKDVRPLAIDHPNPRADAVLTITLNGHKQLFVSEIKQSVEMHLDAGTGLIIRRNVNVWSSPA
jgi:hypothetical protein